VCPQSGLNLHSHHFRHFRGYHLFRPRAEFQLGASRAFDPSRRQFHRNQFHRNQIRPNQVRGEERGRCLADFLIRRWAECRRPSRRLRRQLAGVKAVEVRAGFLAESAVLVLVV